MRNVRVGSGSLMVEPAAGIQPVIPGMFTECMEQLQEGYVAAIAATAGCTAEFKRRDRFGIDGLITRIGAAPGAEEISVQVQLKATSRIRPDPKRTTFPYRLKKRAYFQQLAIKRTAGPKAILVVMSTTPVQADWSKATHDSLEIVHCCYWCSLEGQELPDVSSPTVPIPTSNIFDAAGLTDILDRLDRGEELP